MRSRRFYLVMLKILERKRAEKRALENMHRFYCDPKRHWKTPKHAAAPKAANRRATAQAEPAISSSAPVPPSRGILTERPAGLYAALQVPAAASERQSHTRRKRPKGINAKRLKKAVEKVHKPSALKPSALQIKAEATEPMVELIAEHPADIWHGGYHHRHGQGAPAATR